MNTNNSNNADLSNGVMMNLERSHHADSAIHTSISSGSTGSNNQNSGISCCSTNISGNTNTGNEDADVTMCICPVCGFSASSPRRQDEHMELVHGEIYNVTTTISAATATASIMTVTTENSQSPMSLQPVANNICQPVKLDWPLDRNNNGSNSIADFYQQQNNNNSSDNDNYHHNPCNPFTLQASSTPQRIKLWPNTDQSNPIISITEQMNVAKSDNDEKAIVYTSSEMVGDTIASIGITSNKNNYQLHHLNNSMNPPLEFSSKLKTSQPLNTISKLKQQSPVKSIKSNSSTKDKQKSLSLSSSPLSSTTMTTTATTTPAFLMKTSRSSDDFNQPIVKKVDSRRRYRCNICPTTFPWHGDLTEHLRSVHGMQKSRENARNGKAGSFCCSHCKYVAKYQSELNRHMRLHWGVKPFTCVFCPYRSAWKGDLKRHMESHHRERFSCETELIKIMSQFKNNAGTRSTGGCSSSNLSLSQLDITAESSDGDNVSEQYNCLQIDDEENLQTTSCVTVTSNKNIDIENWDNSSMNNDVRISHNTNSYSDEEPSKAMYSLENDDDDDADADAAAADDDDGQGYIEYSNKLSITMPMTTTNSGNNSSGNSNATTVSSVISDPVVNPTFQSSVFRNLSPCISLTPENRLICDICSYQAQNQSKFKNHMASHMNLRQFKCPVCGQRSNYKWDITKHLKKQHPYCIQLPITVINNPETIDDHHHMLFTSTSSTSLTIPTTILTSTSYSGCSSSLSISCPSSISFSSTSLSSSCFSRTQPFTSLHSQIVSFIPITQQQQQQPVTLFSRPQVAISQSQVSLSSSSSLSSSISPYSNGSLTLETDHKKYSRLSEIEMIQNKVNTTNSPLNLVTYPTGLFKQSSFHNISGIATDEDASLNDSVPIDLSTGCTHKRNIQDEIKKSVLFPTTLSSPSSPTSLKFSSEDYRHQYPIPLPPSSIEFNSPVYSTVSTTSSTLSNMRSSYPTVTYSLRNTSDYNSNPSIMSPYTIGSLISDPLKGNSSSTNAMSLLFNIQQQVLMTGLLQTWQQQQQQQHLHDQKHQELQQNDVIMHSNACGTSSYSDIVMNMTSAPITTMLSTTVCSTTYTTTANRTVTTPTATTNTSFHSFFKSLASHQTAALPVVTAVENDPFPQSRLNTTPVIELSKYVRSNNNNNNNNTNNTYPSNTWGDCELTSEWSVPIEMNSKKSVSSSNNIPVQDQQRQHHNQQQQHQLQVNRFFTPGRRRESHRLLPRSGGRKSAPITSSFNHHSSNTTFNTVNANTSNNNSKEEQWKRFQCSGCGHRSNWKWDINKHIKVAHPERTNITTITLDLEDAKKTYNEYMNRLKLSRSRYLSESIPDVSINSNAWIGGSNGGLPGTTSEGYYRPFKCSVCGHRSNWKWDVGKHIKQIHNGNGEVLTLSLEEARRTIHQYKNRRRQHTRHSDVSIKFEPSFYSSSESNLNLSPVSSLVGDGTIDLPALSNQIVSRREKEVRNNDTDDDDDDEDGANKNSLKNKPSSSSPQSNPLNLVVDNAEIIEDFSTNTIGIIKLSQSSHHRINRRLSSFLGKRLWLKFGCKFCTVRLQSYRSVVFHACFRHNQQLYANGQLKNRLKKWPLYRLHFVHENIRHQHLISYCNQPMKFLRRHYDIMNEEEKSEEEVLKELNPVNETQHTTLETMSNDQCNQCTIEKRIQLIENSSNAESEQETVKPMQRDEKNFSEFPSFVYRNSLKCDRILNRHNHPIHHQHESHLINSKSNISHLFPAEGDRRRHHHPRPFRNLVCLNQANDNSSKNYSNLNNNSNSIFNRSNQLYQQRMMNTKIKVVQSSNYPVY
ncbi:unnamed protein product [Heterobilharzia americana]|nr:unnamed protein product [Heterobilharzia americana]